MDEGSTTELTLLQLDLRGVIHPNLLFYIFYQFTKYLQHMISDIQTFAEREQYVICMHSVYHDTLILEIYHISKVCNVYNTMYYIFIFDMKKKDNILEKEVLL